MQKRKLGKTDLKLSLIGIGGFHLIETPQKEVDFILNKYLDEGGNYIETAADYGDGLSEKKVGAAVSQRRHEFVLASKCGKRSKAETEASIIASLKNLKTDHLDILFMHAVQTIEDADKILASDGAMEAALEAQKNGAVRYIAISGHGKPDALMHSIKSFPYDVLMTGFNYFDRFNCFPQQDELIAECQERGVGLIGMKALADGYLYRSVEQGIRFSLSLPISTLVLGINTKEYLQQDLEIANNFVPMTNDEKEALYSNALELGNYVCRQCKKCDGKTDINPTEMFLLEGEFDRQMQDGLIPDPAVYALRERLKHWFAQNESAIKKYQSVKQVNPQMDYSFLNELCPYNIDIDRKLKLVHSKLSEGEFVF
jgi:uncharacterized protein